MQRKPRKIESFTVHAHIPTGPLDYALAFRDLGNIPINERFERFGPYIIAIAEIDEIDDNLFSFKIHRGDEDSVLVVYDPTTGRERIEHLEGAEILVETTHLVIDCVNQKSLIEYNHRGAKNLDIAHAIGSVLKNHTKHDVVQMNFVADIGEEFMKEISRFERISHAGVRIIRPNTDWTDWMNEFSGLAKESDGRSFDLFINSYRNKTLSKAKGIIAAIENLINSAKSSMDYAKISGRRKGDETDTTISSKKYIRHFRISFLVDEAGRIDYRAMSSRLRNLIRPK